MNTRFTATTAVTCLVLVAMPSLAAKPPPPTDPCATVTEDTFPAFAYTKTIEVSQNVYETGTFLADKTGKCAKLIGTWPRSVNLRYKPDIDHTGVALVLAASGNDIVVGLSSIRFSTNGPDVMELSGPTPVLDTTKIPLPPDLDPSWKFGAPESEWISPDGTQLLMKAMLSTSANEGTGIGPSIVTCSLSYVGSTIEPINPATCREVYRYTEYANWHEIVAWGVSTDTIYSTHPSSSDPTINSLYRLTMQPGTEPVVDEIFHSGGILWGARATWDAATQKEIVAVYEHSPPGGTRCAKVIVIDAYNCTDLSCANAILNQKGMRSITWLPDGRLAGRGQSPPKKGNGTCLETESVVAYPAIDSANTPPTVLTTTPSLPYNLCRTCIEGSGGSW